jgi:hypothetical protein
VAGGIIHVLHDKTEASHGARDIPFPPLMQQLFDEHVRWGRRKLLAPGVTTDAVFIHLTTGSAMTRADISKRFPVAMSLLAEKDMGITCNSVRRPRRQLCVRVARVQQRLTRATTQVRHGLADFVAPLPDDAREGAS